ncbi:MAG: DUF2167 domain-containing protein [Pseudomonadota bacterium]
MRTSRWGIAALGLLWIAFAGPAAAQDDARGQQLRDLAWKVEPAVGNIAGKATLPLAGLRFLDPEPTNKFMELTGNLPRTDSYVVGRKDLGWFAVLDFEAEGFVKDDEKIDADAYLKILKEGNQRSAEERKKRGLPGLTLEGWQLPPQYDSANKRLEWATLLRTDGGEKIVNYSTKLLGRSGYTTATLVSDPQSFTSDVTEFKAAMNTVEYVPGEKYTEWKQGDKIAAYGLGALIVGGAAAVATKKGLWAVIAGFIGAFWKLIVGVAVAAVAGLGSLFKRNRQG